MKKTIELTLEQAKEYYGKDKTIDTILLVNFPELRPKKYEDLGKINGYIIQISSAIDSLNAPYDASHINRNIYKTEKEAKSSLAKAQLSQLMAVYRGDWLPDWNDTSTAKWCISRHGISISIVEHITYYHYLSFPTREIAQEFLTNFEQLIKEYYEL